MFILSRLKVESALIKNAQEGVDPVEKNSAENLKNLLLVNFHFKFLFYVRRGAGCLKDGQHSTR